MGIKLSKTLIASLEVFNSKIINEGKTKIENKKQPIFSILFKITKKLINRKHILNISFYF